MPAAVPLDRTLVAARRAASGLFVLNAVVYANVVPRMPAIKADLELSNTALGAAVAAMPIGALIAGPFGGWLLARYGSARVVTASVCSLGAVVPLFAVAPAWPALAGAFLLLGAADGLMDVSMNAQGLSVQREMGRSIINGMHGLWSVGAVCGGLIGTLCAATGLLLEVHFVAVAAVAIAAGLLLRRWLLGGLDPMPIEPVTLDGLTAVRGRRGRRLALLGLLVVMAAIIEDTPASWGAVFLRTELGSSAALAGLVFVGFQTMMTVGRLLGDRLVDRFGEVPIVRVGGSLVVAGMAAGLAIGNVPGVIVGFAIAGLGASPLFPLVFQAAASVPGVAAGHGLAAVAWLGRVGFLVSPPLVGLLGDAFSLRSGLLVAPAAGVVVVLFAPVLATRTPSSTLLAQVRAGGAS